MAGLLMLAAVASCTGQGPDEAARVRDEGVVSLDGSWSMLLDPAAVGLAEGWLEDILAGRQPKSAPADVQTVAVPGPLEAAPPAVRYDGVAWYWRDFVLEGPVEEARLTLAFEQVNYACRIWLDRQPVGEHEGGYDAFSFDITGRVEHGRSTRLVVMVVDPGSILTFGWTLACTPHGKESWYHNWGGLLGSVRIEVATGFQVASFEVEPEAWWSRLEVSLELVAAPGPHHLDGEVPVKLEVEQLPLRAGDDATAERIVSTLEWNVPLHGGHGEYSGSVTLSGVDRWSPANPRLYRARLFVRGTPKAQRTFGFRSISLKRGDFELNGKRRVLKGVLLQPHTTGGGGVAPSASALEQQVRDILETGFDLVRVHVQPAPEAFLDACDRLGLLVLEEPAIGWVEDDPELLGRLRHEIEWMVTRDRHHPSIVLWGVLNELSGKAYRYSSELALYLASLDSTRPVLEDSGGFLGGGRFVPVGGSELLPMVDEHFYPPSPLPLEERERMRIVGRDGVVPVFASEFGYGALLDAERVARGFRARKIWSEERFLFDGATGTVRRARASGEAWLDNPLLLGWKGQAEAAEDMIATLRSNPAVDLLCYTQWQAVSHEYSSGVLAPWGEPRPVQAAIRHALQPLALFVSAGRLSIYDDESVTVRVAVVNDTGQPVQGELVLTPAHHGAGTIEGTEVDLGSGPFAPGVTERQATVEAGSGSVLLEIRAALTGTHSRADSLRIPVLSRVSHRAADRPSVVWVPGGDSAALAFVERQGFGVGSPAAGPVDVALLTRPQSLSKDLSLQDRMRLWHHAWHGGAVVALLNDPTAGAVVRNLRNSAGATTLAAFPVPVRVARAAGNFMGRLHVARFADQGWSLVPEGIDLETARGHVRPLGREEASLSPVAMVVGELPADSAASVITLGALGNRIGSPVLGIPFGRGRIDLVGLPLLPSADSASDPLREAVLAQLIRDAGSAVDRRRGDESTPAWTAPSAGNAQALNLGLGLLARIAALADQVRSALPSPGALPPYLVRVDRALAAGREALEALAKGDDEGARQKLTEAVVGVWDDEVKTFLGLDDRVRELLHDLLQRGERDAYDRAYEAFELWHRGLRSWFAGERDIAFAFLGRAELALRGKDG